MMTITTAFIRGEAAAASKNKGHLSWKSQDHSKRKATEQKLTSMSSPREGRGLAFGDNWRRRPLYKSVDGFHDRQINFAIKRYHWETGHRYPCLVPSSHGMLKFPADGGIVTIRGTILIPAECATVITSPKEIPKEAGTSHQNLKVAIHPNFPDQEVAIGGTLSLAGRTELCTLLKKNLDIFAWQPSDMTGVPRSIAEHRLNIRVGIMREVYYHDWMSNPVMVKKHDGSWRMCVDFTNLNKACPQDCYPLPEIDWKIESLCGYPFKCFLDAYKGYHQIQMAESDEEKMAFHTSQGVYCYTKMPFGLKNAGATYQQLVDRAFDSQVGRNMEVYVDDLVIKTVEGMFLGYTITPEGIKPCPDKTEAVLQLPSPRTIKEVQSLNGKLASLNRFLSKSAEKSLPLFKTLKRCIKKSNFRWTPKAEQAFKQLKQHLSELPLLVAPKQKEELIVYLSASYKAVSAVLMIERGTVQKPVYFISRALQGLELNYTPMEKRIISSYKRLIVVATPSEPWTLFTDGSSCVDGSGAEEDGPTWMTPIMEYLKDGTLPDDRKEASKLRIKARQYELMEGTLYRRSFLKPCLRCVGPLQAGYVIREIHEGSRREIISDNGKQFSDNPFKNWCDKLNITQRFASLKHPQSNGLVERENGSLGEGIKARLDEGNKNWLEELPHVLWAHRTMIKSSHGDTPFSLTYGTEAVIPAEIGMPTYRTVTVDTVHNDEELRLNLDLLEEKRERAAIYEAKAKMKMTKYYNARVRGVAFRPEDFVYRSNDASHAATGGKLKLKWEGPYEVTEALGDGAYKLRTMDDTDLPRT
ncbi:reverse transcriptase domain-containing protein [Tanacetum coccineum]